MRQVIARLVLLLAVLLMPLGMAPATADSPGHHAMAGAMAMGHCDEQTPNHAPKAGFADCTMACSAALPAADLPRDEPPPLARVPLRAAAAVTLRGLHPDTATPPPRLA